MVKVKESSSAGEKVTVALKHPNGLYLQLFKMEPKDVLSSGGTTREVMEAVPFGERVKLNGSAHPFGVIPEYRIVAGYALTEGVDNDFFDEWMAQNKDSAIVKNDLIFAYEKTADAVAQAKDGAKLLSGLEPLAQAGDSRAPRRIRPDDTKIAA